MRRKRAKPVVHSRDHEHGGADPVRIHFEDVGTSGGGTGGGIQFDTTPQAGGFLQITTSEYLYIEANGTDSLSLDHYGTGDINLYNQNANVNLDAGSGINMVSRGDGGIVIHADGTGGMVLWVEPTNVLLIQGLPTSDPGVANAIWNDGGYLRIS